MALSHYQNIDLSAVVPSDIHLRANSSGIPYQAFTEITLKITYQAFTEIILKITYLIFLSIFPGVNELNKDNFHFNL